MIFTFYSVLVAQKPAQHPRHVKQRQENPAPNNITSYFKQVLHMCLTLDQNRLIDNT